MYYTLIELTRAKYGKVFSYFNIGRDQRLSPTMGEEDELHKHSVIPNR